MHEKLEKLEAYSESLSSVTHGAETDSPTMAQESLLKVAMAAAPAGDGLGPRRPRGRETPQAERGCSPDLILTRHLLPAVGGGRHAFESPVSVLLLTLVSA